MFANSTRIRPLIAALAAVFSFSTGSMDLGAKPKRDKAKPEAKADEQEEDGSKKGRGRKQAKEDPAETDDEASEPVDTEPTEEEQSVTKGVVKIGGQDVRYKATAGTLRLVEEGSRPAASIFYIAYEREGVKNRSKRPVTFCFNGGPGSSSVWLHLGAFGPRRIPMNPEGTDSPPPPYALVDNPDSLLDVTDLVFIDPVSTGYSRSEDPKKAGEFHGFQEDIDSVAEFVRLYITREGRWGSPKYLAGESYGAIRGSGLAATLQDRYGMYLNGVVIVSGVWDFRTLIPHNSNDLPYMLFLPTMAAAAHYHGKVRGDLKQLVSEAEEFALGDYALALHQGAALPEAEEKKVANRMAKLLGIDAGYVSDAGLRVSPWAFRKELLRDSDKTIGRFDARMIGFDAGKLGEGPDYDASYNLIYGAYASGLKDYLRTELKFESDLPYEVLTGKVRPWNYDQFTNRYVSVADHVAGSLSKNKHLRYFVACGYYDLATPHLAIEYTLDHLEIPKHLRKNFAFGYYAGGHMMYTNEKALAELKKDLAKFIKDR